MVPRRIIWHHSAVTSQKYQFNGINEEHKNRRFPISKLGFFVGYHYLIEYDGTIRQARREDEIGAHDKGENFDSIGICLAGNFNYAKPTEEQAKAAAKLTKQIIKRWKISLKRIEPHRRNDATNCPGKMLKDNWFVKNYVKREKSNWRKLLRKLKLMK